jgi:SAM-dependent methyltransferase
MPGYHKYVFDTERRQLVGNFEAMYQAEDAEGFDSWFERDLVKELRKPISHTLLSQYNFVRILDVGCGKGTFTHLLKKRNNQVVGIDLSPTAIEKARHSFPDIDFRCGDISQIDASEEKFDLVLVMGTFAYIEDWSKALETIAGLTRWFYVAEYIPPNPIGFVKSPQHLIGEVEKHFNIRTKVLLDDVHCLLLSELK